MESLDTLLDLAQRLGRAKFSAERASLSLVKVPLSGKAAAESEDTDKQLQYKTQHVSLNLRNTEAAFERMGWAVEVKKRPGKPFPERITVGRAPNVDVVLRFGYISKLHAYFQVTEQGEMFLHDHNSANGTAANGIPVRAGSPVRIQAGDALEFGALRVQVMGAGDLHDRLRAGDWK